MSGIFADIHCHPSMKAFGKSFNGRIQSNDSGSESSTWYRKRPAFFNKALNELFGLTTFTQSDFTSLCRGNVRVVCASLYPLEKKFLVDADGNTTAPDALMNFITGIGRNRIDFIQSHNDYFSDLNEEYKFLQSLENSLVTCNGENYTYKLARSGNDIKTFANANPANTVINVLTIEGAHVFNCGLHPERAPAIESGVLNNVMQVKNWQHPPLFITFAHHFYNELCGHAKSLHLPMQKKFRIDQELGMDEGLTSLGKKVIESLLDKSSGRRILIDIKHMSRKSRKEYFKMLKQDFSSENVPLVASHGGVTGLKDENGMETIINRSRRFLHDDINFYDDELLEIGKKGGLFGIQLDERRIASTPVLNDANTGDIQWHFENWAKPLWFQVQHVAEVLDHHGLPAWDIQCLGTDFDGIINPIGPYWTAAEMTALSKSLLYHAKEFFRNGSNTMRQPANRNMQPEEVVSRFMGDNAIGFIVSNYN